MTLYETSDRHRCVVVTFQRVLVPGTKSAQLRFCTMNCAVRQARGFADNCMHEEIPTSLLCDVNLDHASRVTHALRHLKRSA